MESKVYIVFDTETVGLDPSENGSQVLTISAGVLDMESREVVVEFNQYSCLTTEVEAKIYVEHYLGADTEVRYATVRDALDRSGWSKTLQRDGSEKEVLHNFYCYVTSFSSPVLLAYNATFDMRMVNRRLKHYGLPALDVQVIDVMQTARLELEPILEERNDFGDLSARQMLRYVTFQTEKRTWKSYKLENLAKMFNVYTDRAHESQADIVMAGQVYLSIKNYVGDSKPHPKYLARSLKNLRSLGKYFRSEGNWKRIHGRKCKQLLSLCVKNSTLAIRAYRDFLVAELLRENRRNRGMEQRSRLIMDNLLSLNELSERQHGKKEVAKLIYFGML